jgi:hypothetical protein
VGSNRHATRARILEQRALPGHISGKAGECQHDSMAKSSECPVVGRMGSVMVRLLTRGDVAKRGIGVSTDERWKRTYDDIVSAGLLKADVDYEQAFTTQCVRDLKVIPSAPTWRARPTT